MDLIVNPFAIEANLVFCKGVLKIFFAKFTGKHLWQSLFFNRVVGLWVNKKVCSVTSDTVHFCVHL